MALPISLLRKPLMMYFPSQMVSMMRTTSGDQTLKSVTVFPSTFLEDGDKMKEKVITVYIHDLEISDKSKSFLVHVGLIKLNDLLDCDMTELSTTRNISDEVLQELNGVIAHAADIISFFEARAKRISDILPDVQDTPIKSLGLGTRATNALRRGGIHTAGALIQMSRRDIWELHNVGVLIREE